jgi:hypothetical protein
MIPNKELRNDLAELCHSQWSNWMKYLFSKGTFNDDGSWTMPSSYVTRWTRQMLALYKDLLPVEQQSDLIEADKFLDVFISYGK